MPRPGHRHLYLAGFAALLVAAAMWALLHFLFPTPPSNIPAGVGFKGGTYEIFFAQYQKILARQRVSLEYRSTGGAVANPQLLEDRKSDVQVGFVQGGIRNSSEAPGLLSLGRVAYQPFYIFYRADQTIDDLAQLKGKRIAIGASGNGSAVAAEKILAAAGVTAQNSTFTPQFAKAAVDALIDGKADVMFEAFSNEEVVKAAMRDPRIRMLSVRGADALVRLFPYLSKIVLPQGVVDSEHNIPPADVTMISTTVGVLVREDLHPAIITLLAEALIETHRRPGLYNRADEFPTQTDPEFPMAPAAVDYYRNGPSFLNRYVPFWITNSAQRILAVLVAVFGVILPLARFLPHIRGWFVRQRFENWYSELQTLEAAATATPSEERRAELIADLLRIEGTICATRLPRDYTAQRYSLRGHIDMVRRKINAIGAVP
jgi:TRAP-type uncharacterized transport system substrate-binding protein